MPAKLSAPIKQGEVICQARVIYADQEITTINLVAANDVRLSMFRLFMTNLRRVLSSTPFILLELAALIVLAPYIVLVIVKHKKPKKPSSRRVEGGKSGRQ
jgi:D-alanyl-D-alanine carboxypeptidase (penicillin-binding protein 5/6)